LNHGKRFIDYYLSVHNSNEKNVDDLHKVSNFLISNSSFCFNARSFHIVARGKMVDGERVYGSFVESPVKKNF
jgi:hypothetical protein